MQRHCLPLTWSRSKGSRCLGPWQIHAGTIQQADARIAGAQVAADLVLEFVPRLWRVPARGPGEGNLLAVFPGAGVTLHGKGKGRVGILGLTRLMHADVGPHGGASAVAVGR